MHEQHTVILGIGEGLLIDLVLSGLHGAGVRAHRGVERPADAELVQACRAILDCIEQARVQRQGATRATIANAMEPAAA